MEQADRYFNLILDEIEYLAEYPEHGEDYSQIKKEYFRSRIKSHFIFYKINSKIEGIEVIRILHQRMDLESRIYD
ncbi:type II toxin-antitoxin system RelE/ParE family toxin [Nonlabens spongiae]|uniref:type II toxin-antitoxin system RelE/ParE family toxin n=1 Tax=Nonlabens spongiae TaxID=331648 RepID=UPI001FE2A797|nr:type II toxin-antitoxin system RelE/ParE family toxin [Nonlabens spongiae]